MVDIARVTIWGQFAGAISWNESSKSTAFEYDKNFIKQGYDIAPLQMSLDEAKPDVLFWMTAAMALIGKGFFAVKA